MMFNILAPIISLAITPQVCMAPCQVQVTVRIEKAEASDKAYVDIEDTGSTDIVVQEGKRTYVLPHPGGFYTIHEAGEYTVSAHLLRRGEKETSASVTLVVHSGE